MKTTKTKTGVTIKMSDDELFDFCWSVGEYYRKLRKKAEELRKDRNEAEKEGAEEYTIKALTDLIESNDAEAFRIGIMARQANTALQEIKD